MSNGTLLQRMMRLVLVIPLLVGCAGAPARPAETAIPLTPTLLAPTGTSTQTPPTATFTLLPPTATFTPVPPTATFTPVLPTATPVPFSITDQSFEASYRAECETDCDIVSVEGDSFRARGSISMREGRFTLWCYGANHTWIGELTYAGYTFASDENDPLQFRVDRDKGYVYVEGKGTITFPDGSSVTLPR